jgi:hypothetical protein
VSPSFFFFLENKFQKRAKKLSSSLAKESALIPLVKYMNRPEDKSQNNQESQKE